MTLFLVVGAASTPHSPRALAASEDSAASAGQSPQNATRAATHPATLKPVAAKAADIAFRDCDSEAEQVLLQLANQARRQAGAPQLALDTGLTQAARAHAERMFAARRLSHQFDGEPSLPQRLAVATRAQLDQEAENVALDFDPEQGHQHLMQSPPHRANLLNPAYNAVGVGVVRGADRLYIVQDFGHALPNYSTADVKEQIAAALAQARAQARQPALTRRDLPNSDDAACSMAQADKLGTSPIQQLAQRYTVLTYTSLHPGALPENGMQAVSSRNLRSFSVGACYARTATYPTGVYWVLLALD
ncbi:MAG: CAP domain-containing protein [Candidatus Sulfotelmatobacter sp.]